MIEIEGKHFLYCKLCGKKERYKIISPSHLRSKHQITMAEYRSKFPEALLVCSVSARNQTAHLRKKSYEEVYGEEKGKKLKKIRSKRTTKQMEDVEQREVRSEKCGKYTRTDVHKEIVSKSSTKSGNNTYRRRALDYYGLKCQRCSFTSENEEDFSVHHKDFLNINTELGDHSVGNLGVLCKSCHAKLHNEVKRLTGRFVGLDAVEKGVHYILKGLRDELGLDLTDFNFKDTPKRVARSYYEIFEGLVNTKEEVSKILESAFPCSEYDSVIFCSDIETYSMCPHHLLPVEYRIDIGYLPQEKGKALGLSKLVRIVELLSRRPVLQEVLTQDIVEALERINPRGIGVIVRGKHFCMRMRGVKNNAGTTTSAMYGNFRTDSRMKEEFFSLLEISKLSV